MRPTILDHVVNWTIGATMGTMTMIVFASVVFRYVLDRPLSWSEELASLLFAWVTFLGAYVGFRSRSHIAIDTLVIFLPGPVRAGIAWAMEGLALLILGLFVWQGVSLCRATWSLEFPAMEISRGYLYLSLPVGAALMIIASVQRWREGRAAREKGGGTPEGRP